MLFVFPVPAEDSSTLETEQSPRQAPLPDDDEDENESGGEGHNDGRASVILRKFQVSEEGESEESDGGGQKEEASNNRDGDSSPMASINILCRCPKCKPFKPSTATWLTMS